MTTSPVALVTGAGSPTGIGMAVARRLGRLGHHVVVTSTTGRIHDRVAELLADGIGAEGVVCDLTDSDAADSLVLGVAERHGRLDVVVNNAGPVNVSRPAWKWMKANGGGRIVNVSSGAAFGGVPDGSLYAMAKMGVIGLTRGMASEGAPHGIGVNVVVPYAKTRPGTAFGPIPWSPALGEWLSPRLVAPLVVWLGHESCSLNGETISVGAGWAAGVHLELRDGYTNRDATSEDIAANVDTMMGGPSSPLTATSSMAVRHLLKGFRS